MTQPSPTPESPDRAIFEQLLTLLERHLQAHQRDLDRRLEQHRARHKARMAELDRLHRMIIVGFVVFLLAFCALVGMTVGGIELDKAVSLIQSFCFGALVVFAIPGLLELFRGLFGKKPKA